MKFSLFNISVIGIALFILASCKEKNSDESSLVNIQSNPTYVQLIVNRDDMPILEDLTSRNYLCDSQLITEKGNSFEPKFDYFIGALESPEQLKLDERMVVIFEHSSKFEPFHDNNSQKVTDYTWSKPEVHISVYHDIWGKGQTVIYFDLSDVDNMENWCAAHWKQIETIIDTENEKMGIIGIDGYSESFNQPSVHGHYTDSIDKLFRNQYHFSLLIPNQYRIMQADSESIWISNLNKNFGFQSVFINIIKNDRADKWKLGAWKSYSTQELVENRNAFTHVYMHNDEGTKMEVSESGIYKSKLKKSKNGNPMLLGWYTELGTYRRGPFFRTLYNDASRHRIIAVDCFFNNTNANHVNKLLLSNIASTFSIVP